MSIGPLRLAIGNHVAGSGMGCAMNVISWENGDEIITHYPINVYTKLSSMIQIVNDLICSHRNGNFLCPDCSIKVLHLAHKAVGTDILTTDPNRLNLANNLHTRMNRFIVDYVYEARVGFILKDNGYAAAESIIDDVWAYIGETPTEPNPEIVETAIKKMMEVTV